MSLRKTYTITRFGAGQYVGGFWVEGTMEQFDIQASAQPLRPEEVESLPEGRRTEQAFKIYTDTELKVADSGNSQNSDLITIQGEDYEIISVSPYKSGVIDHYKAIAVKPIP